MTVVRDLVFAVGIGGACFFLVLALVLSLKGIAPSGKERLRDRQQTYPQQPAGPFPPPPETGDDVSSTNRRIEITVAVIAVVGVLLGGGVAALSSYWTAHMTIQSQQQQSLEQYRRDKRHEIYVNLLTQLTSLETTLRQIQIDHLKQALSLAGTQPAPPSDQPQPLPEDLTKQNDDKWQAAYDKFSAAISTAQLVSSRRIIELSKALRDAYSNSYYGLAYPKLLESAAAGMAVSLGIRPVLPESSNPPAAPAPSAPPPPPILPPPEYDQSLTQLPTWQLRSMFVEEAKTEIDLND
jgi:hypothetical protein